MYSHNHWSGTAAIASLPARSTDVAEMVATSASRSKVSVSSIISIGSGRKSQNLRDMIASPLQIDHSLAARALSPLHSFRLLFKQPRTCVLNAAPRMFLVLALGASLRFALRTLSDIVLDVLWADKSPAVRRAAVRQILCFALPF